MDEFAPRLCFFFNAHIDFFEEIAKYRAARRIWARELRDTYGARDERSLLMRFHTQTAGVSLTAQQPLNNVVRTATEALVGGARRHPVAAHQQLRRGARAADRGGGAAGAADAADHRARDRRDEHDRPARRLVLRRVADRPHGGGGVRLLRQDRRAGRDGRRDQAELPAARDRRRGVHAPGGDRARQRIIVGVNRYQQEGDRDLEILRIPPELERKQIGRVQAVRARRDADAVEAALTELRDVGRGRPQPDGARCSTRRAPTRPRARSSSRSSASSARYTETPVF